MSTGVATLPAVMYVVGYNGVIPNTNPQADLSSPDDKSTIWPAPHDAKLELAVVIREALGQLNGANGQPLNSWIKVIEYGTFQTSMLRDDDNRQVPVIILNRSSDVPIRRGLGEEFGIFPAGAPDLTDASSIVPPGGAVNFRGQASRVMVDIWIFDTLPDRADQLYTIVKTILIALQTVMMKQLGYFEVTRVNGMDQQQIQIDQGGNPYVIFQRIITVRIEHPDYIAGAQQVAHLISQTQSLEDLDGAATGAKTTADFS
jgi:hypothetical protein